FRSLKVTPPIIRATLSRTIRIVAGSVLIAAKTHRPVASRVLGLVLLLVTSGCTYITASSVSSTEEQGNGGSLMPAISANGRFVAFVSVASNLVENDTNNAPDVFVRDE